MMNKTCAVVVTYNRKTLLEQAVKCLLQQTCPCDILIVDNASTDGTNELINIFTDKRISYYNTGKNIGGAGGFNIGMKKAVEAGYQYVWVMDDDTFCQTDTLEQFFIADKKLNGDYGWLSSKALWTDGNICEMNRQVSINRKAITDFSEELIPSYRATFVSMFVKSEVIIRYGLPIKEFFIWADDTEYTIRIANKKHCYVVSKSVVNHAMQTNSSANIVNIDHNRISRCYYQIRNHCYIVRANHKILWMPIYFYRQSKKLLKILLHSPSYRFRRIYFLTKGILAGLFFYPSVEYVNKK